MRAIVLSAFLAVVSGCDSGSDLREWQPSDHQHTAQGPSPGSPKQTPAGAAPDLPNGLTEVALVAWKRNCVNCHGVVGRGDGPQGVMLKARNLTDPAWQAEVTDEQIAEVIRKGKGTMPPSGLPENTIQDLVRLVRMLGGRRPQQDTPASASDTPPANSSPPKPGPSAPAP